MTFEREFMAGLCLAIVWVNTGLITAHGLGDLRRILGLRRRLAGTVGRFEVTAGEGPSYRLVQAGRTRGDGSIHFHDRRTECAVTGEVRLETPQGGAGLAADAGAVWVWPSEADVRAATACASRAEYDALAGSALHARGAERVALVQLQRGVVAGGRVVSGALRGDADLPIIFSSVDPRRRLGALAGRIIGVLAGSALALALLTALCFVGPAFGTVSIVAALGLFVYFLLVQPLGVWLSESVQWPHVAPHGGLWVRNRLPTATPSELVSSPATSG